MDNHLHIITHEIPWPTQHGGLVDIGYKLKALHKAGVKIHLHVFCKKIREEQMLNNWCEEVNYYKRSMIQWLMHPTLPYMVASRISKKLNRRLQQDNHPILFEGTHTSYPLVTAIGHQRKTAIRLHNIEHIYYRKLATTEQNPLKKIYFIIESVLLKKYEKWIFTTSSLFPVSKHDFQTLQIKFPNHHIQFLPVFTPWQQINSENGKGSYCLYHGNLSVSENAYAAAWLLKHIFLKIEIPFVIAGKNPPHWLRKLAHQQNHTCIVSNPNDHEMEDLIRKAQLHILPSFNATGVKLKLIHVLYAGRHCLTNENTVDGSGIEKLCIQYKDMDECRDKVLRYYNIDFNEEEKQKRSGILNQLFNTDKNINDLITWLS